MNEDVEYHGEFDTMDPVFNPQLTYVSEEYNDAVQEQIEEMCTGDIEALADNYALVSKVIDMKKSPAFKDGTVQPFRTDDTVVTLEKDKEPSMQGSLKTACSVSDALTLQYYEEEDPVKAGFGNKLGEDQWTEIADIKDVYNEVLFTVPLIAYNVANPLLKEIKSEMNEKDRKFTFLCGHDSNIGSVLAALDVSDYDLPDTIEKKAPIGVKLVFSKWKSPDGELYWDADLVYQTTEQLRNVDLLTEENNPASVDLDFNGLSQNSDSLFTDKDLKDRFKKAIGEYDNLAKY
jgi:glucose-1-phosphatase